MKNSRTFDLPLSKGLHAHAGHLQVLLADDQVLFTETMSKALAGAGITVESVPSFDALVAELSKTYFRVDLVIIDLSLRTEHALDCLGILKGRFPEIKVAWLTGDTRPDILREAMNRHGAIGVIPRNSTLKSLATAIRFMAVGEPFLPASLLEPSEEATTDEVVLSSEETDILRQIAEGLSNREIAATTGLPEMTVKGRLKSICRKLNVHNRTKAAIVARAMGFI